MAKIIIIGASLSGHSVAVNLRQAHKDCSITLVTEESFPYYDRRRLFDLLSCRITEKDIFLSNTDFYRQNNIEFISDAKATSVNAQKKAVYLKDREALGYDFLVVCSGRKFVLPDIPGAKKSGVFCLYTLGDIKKMENFFLGDTICLVGSRPFVLQSAESFASKNKEVKVINPSGTFAVNQELERIEVINTGVLEIIGESSVQAVKLNEGKIIAASSVIFMDELKSSRDFLKNTGIEIEGDFINVDGQMRSSINNIFSCGTVARARGQDGNFKGFDDILNESRILAETIVKSLEQQ